VGTRDAPLAADRDDVFSSTHCNFAITLEGPFRRALLAAAR
jgi:hypothetical protein